LFLKVYLFKKNLNGNLRNKLCYFTPAQKIADILPIFFRKKPIFFRALHITFYLIKTLTENFFFRGFFNFFLIAKCQAGAPKFEKGRRCARGRRVADP
jgi:hypothetical protein